MLIIFAIGLTVFPEISHEKPMPVMLLGGTELQLRTHDGHSNNADRSDEMLVLSSNNLPLAEYCSVCVSSNGTSLDVAERRRRCCPCCCCCCDDDDGGGQAPIIIVMMMSSSFQAAASDEERKHRRHRKRKKHRHRNEDDDDDDEDAADDSVNFSDGVPYADDSGNRTADKNGRRNSVQAAKHLIGEVCSKSSQCPAYARCKHVEGNDSKTCECTHGAARRKPETDILICPKKRPKKPPRTRPQNYDDDND